jgi:uncharacterized protein YjbI with pentapeptide repeats
MSDDPHDKSSDEETTVTKHDNVLPQLVGVLSRISQTIEEVVQKDFTDGYLKSVADSLSDRKKKNRFFGFVAILLSFSSLCILVIQSYIFFVQTKDNQMMARSMLLTDEYVMFNETTKIRELLLKAPINNELGYDAVMVSLLEDFSGPKSKSLKEVLSYLLKDQNLTVKNSAVIVLLKKYPGFVKEFLNESEGSDVRLSGIYFSDTDLTKLKLKCASFQDSKFNKVDMSFSVLTSSDLSQSEFIGAKFTSSFFISSNLRSSKIGNAQFNFGSLSGSNFSEAYVSEVLLYGTSIRGSNFESTALLKTDFSGNDATATIFDNSIIRKVGFYGVNLRDSSFNYSSLRSVDFSGSSLGKASFRGTDFTKLEANHADLSFVDLQIACDYSSLILNNTNIFNIKNVPDGFIDDALKSGAVWMTPEEWFDYSSQNQIR